METISLRRTVDRDLLQAERREGDGQPGCWYAFEVDDRGDALRQIEFYESRYTTGEIREDEQGVTWRGLITDQPMYNEIKGREEWAQYEISSEDFEALWQEALRREAQQEERPEST